MYISCGDTVYLILRILTCTLLYVLEPCALCVFASTGVMLLKTVYGCLFHKDLGKSFTLSTLLALSYQLCQIFSTFLPKPLHSPWWFHSQVYSVFTASCQHLKQTSQLCILINVVSTQKKSLHSPVSLVIYVSLNSTVAESNPFFLFSLSDLLVPSFPRSLISVPPFTLLSLPVTSHIKPFCTLLFVPLFNARAPLFLQSFSHKTLKALIPLCNILWRKHFFTTVAVLYFLMLCFWYFEAALCVHKQSRAFVL